MTSIRYTVTSNDVDIALINDVVQPEFSLLGSKLNLGASLLARKLYLYEIHSSSQADALRSAINQSYVEVNKG